MSATYEVHHQDPLGEYVITEICADRLNVDGPELIAIRDRQAVAAFRDWTHWGIKAVAS